MDSKWNRATQRCCAASMERIDGGCQSEATRRRGPEGAVALFWLHHLHHPHIPIPSQQTFGPFLATSRACCFKAFIPQFCEADFILEEPDTFPP